LAKVFKKRNADEEFFSSLQPSGTAANVEQMRNREIE